MLKAARFWDGSIPTLIFVLLLATVFAHLCVGGITQPLGGPNAILGAAAAFLAVFYALRTAASGRKRSAVISALVEKCRPVLPVIAVSLLLLIWALTVYLFTDTLAPKRLAQMALGIGILFAVYLSVDSVSRATLLAMAVVMATVVSALFGVGIIFVGDPFLTIWLHIATVKARVLPDILITGRTAGLSPDTIAFSYQLAVAIPLAFTALLYNPFEQGRRSGAVYSTALFVMLMTLVTVLLMNATRSAILGVLVGVAIVVFPSARMPQISRRLFFIVPLIVVWLLVFFNPVFSIAELVSGIAEIIDGDVRPGVVIRYRFIGLTAEKEYTFQIRTRTVLGDWRESEEVTATVASDGTLVLNWPAPDDPKAITAYQFRVRGPNETEWRPWRDFFPSWPLDQPPKEGSSVAEKIAWARKAQDVSTAELEGKPRVLYLGQSAQSRIHMAMTALRYSLDHPLGTGRYSPTTSHIGTGLDAWLEKKVLTNTPHNQFLNILVYYGYPGLVLLILFYVLVLKSLIRSGLYILQSRDAALYLLATGVAGAIASYGVNSLLHNAGPFVGDWGHFFIIGLVFSLQRIGDAHKAKAELTQS